MRRTLCWTAVAVALALAPTAHAQLHCSPTGNHVVAPGSTITLSGWSYSLPPGGYIDNWVVWVNGTSHTGQTYQFTSDPNSNPIEYVYHCTGTAHYFGHSYNWDSASANGDGRCGDIIAMQGLAPDSITYTQDYPLYQRDWTDGTKFGRDVPRPQWGSSGTFPACYQKGSAVTVDFHTTGNGNNGVTLVYSLTATLTLPDDVTVENVSGWPLTIATAPYTAGAVTEFVTPNLPDCIFKHHLHLDFVTQPRFAVDGALGQNAHTGVISTIYAVFADPNSTFPPYHLWDDDAQALQHKPWYEIIDNAVGHVTTDDTNATVTDTFSAMQNLTIDLYVWPYRPWGAATSLYDPSPPNYYAYNIWHWQYGLPADPLRFDLWGMALSTHGDCQDFSSYLECQGDSLGIGSVTKRRLNGTFTTNWAIHCGLVIPAPDSFAFHQMTYWPDGGGIFDWAVAYPYAWWPVPPPWYLSTGMSLADQFTTLVYSGSPTWGDPFFLGGSEPNWGTTGSILCAYPRGH